MKINYLMKHFWFLPFIIVILLSFIFFLLNKQETSSNNWLQLGEMFFAGLAFAGIIVALFLQMQELKLQRQELTASRKAMQEQASALKGQHAMLQQQAFEQTFFNLVNKYNSIVEQNSKEKPSVDHVIVKLNNAFSSVESSTRIEYLKKSFNIDSKDKNSINYVKYNTYINSLQKDIFLNRLYKLFYHIIYYAIKHPYFKIEKNTLNDYIDTFKYTMKNGELILHRHMSIIYNDLELVRILTEDFRFFEDEKLELESIQHNKEFKLKPDKLKEATEFIEKFKSDRL